MAFQYVIVKNSGRGRGYLPTIMPEASNNGSINNKQGTCSGYHAERVPCLLLGFDKNLGQYLFVWCDIKRLLIRENDEPRFTAGWLLDITDFGIIDWNF